mmetsp:Transcript_16276/g.33494  ORF Transcript_16276/g.33494 Transcript_16276/m.33494 type:complete len:266 (+) Transcript_16276:123-920(+)
MSSTVPSSDTSPTFTATCLTTKGDFSVKFIRSWAPLGYDRIRDLFEDDFFEGMYMYRVVPKFLVQFGVPTIQAIDQEVLDKYKGNTIKDDPMHLHPFEKGTISYAGSGPNSRVSDLFISYSNNGGLGNSPWEVPVGYVTEGMEVVESFHSYGDLSVFNPKGPDQNKLRNQGETYVKDNFPLMDHIISCSIERPLTNPDSLSTGATIAASRAALVLMLASGFSIIVLVRRLWCGEGKAKLSSGASDAGVSRSLNSSFVRASEDKLL